jgi:hypothetical protein
MTLRGAAYDTSRARVSSGLAGAGAKLFRQRSRILQLLQQGTLATLTSAPAGIRIWSPEFDPPAGFTADENTPRSQPPHSMGIHQRHVSLAHRLCRNCAGTPSGSVPSISWVLLWGIRTDCGHVLDGTGRVLRPMYDGQLEAPSCLLLPTSTSNTT